MTQDQDNKRRKPTVIMPATRLLQSVVGKGKIAQDRIGEAQTYIERVRDNIEVEPFAEKHITEIKTFLEILKAGDGTEEITDKMSSSIMNFKSNAGMFSHGVYVNLAAIMLRWIESVENIDEDVLDVLNGYLLTLEQIFGGRITDDQQITAIVQEMESACERYFAKHPELQLTLEIGNNNAFYIDETELESHGISTDLDKELTDEKLIGEAEEEGGVNEEEGVNA